MRVPVGDSEIFVGTGAQDWVADRPVLVFQHGAGMNRTVWVLLARYFARHGFNVVAADLPGHGASGGVALTSIEAQAEHLVLLLEVLREHFGLPKAPLNFIGHSMGALIVAEAVARRPEDVNQLILLGAGYPMMVGQPLLDAARANDQAAVDMIAIYSHSFASQLGHNPVAGISVQNSAMALLEQSAPGVLYTDLSACNQYDGLETSAAEIIQHERIQCTVVSGDHDRMTPLRAAGATAGLLNAHHRIIPDCGHMMMSEQPEQTLQAIKACFWQSE